MTIQHKILDQTVLIARLAFLLKQVLPPADDCKNKLVAPVDGAAWISQARALIETGTATLKDSQLGELFLLRRELTSLTVEMRAYRHEGPDAGTVAKWLEAAGNINRRLKAVLGGLS